MKNNIFNKMKDNLTNIDNKKKINKINKDIDYLIKKINKTDIKLSNINEYDKKFNEKIFNINNEIDEYKKNIKSIKNAMKRIEENKKDYFVQSLNNQIINIENKIEKIELKYNKIMKNKNKREKFNNKVNEIKKTLNKEKEKLFENKKIKKVVIIFTILLIGIICISLGMTKSEQEDFKNEIAPNSSNISSEEKLNKTKEIENITNEIKNNENTNILISQKDEKENNLNIKKFNINEVSKFSGSPYIKINNNIPFFMESDLTTNSYENYSNLDSKGRCGMAISSIGMDIMPTEKRGNIGNIKPSGWHTVKYAGINGNYLYNRCHLIGYQLTGENDNERNLITGTRYLNIEGMLPFENMVADYIKETNNHVLYRVTPIFEGENLLASGVLMEAKSVEDNGKSIEFNVYCYNIQPGIEINYLTGESSGPEFKGNNTNNNTTNNINNNKSNNKTNKVNTSTNTKSQTKSPNLSDTYVLNKNSKIFHKSNCSSVNKMSEKNKETYNGSRDDIINRGYKPCKRCNP